MEQRRFGLRSLARVLLPLMLALSVIAPALLEGRGTSAQATGEIHFIYGSGSATGGKAVSFRVELTEPAPVGGAVVELESSNESALDLPDSVTVGAGQTERSFGVGSTPVNVDTDVIVSASYGGVTKSRTVLIKSPVLSSLSVQSRIRAGGQGKIIVRLSGRAPSAGLIVNVNSNRPSVIESPGDVTVEPGDASVTLIVDAAFLTTEDVPINITARFRGVKITEPTIVRHYPDTNATATAEAAATETAAAEQTMTAISDGTEAAEVTQTVIAQTTETAAANETIAAQLTASAAAEQTASAQAGETESANATNTAIAAQTESAEAALTASAAAATQTAISNEITQTAIAAENEATQTAAANEANATMTQQAVNATNTAAANETSTAAAIQTATEAANQTATAAAQPECQVILGDLTGTAANGDIYTAQGTNAYSFCAVPLPGGAESVSVTEIYWLSAEIEKLNGECGAGSPRYQLRSTGGGQIFVYFGDYPNYASCADGFTGNLLADGNARCDTSQVGGTFYDSCNPYDLAGLLGDNEINRVALVLDGTGQTFRMDPVVLFGNELPNVTATAAVNQTSTAAANETATAAANETATESAIQTATESANQTATQVAAEATASAVNATSTAISAAETAAAEATASSVNATSTAVSAAETAAAEATVSSVAATATQASVNSTATQVVVEATQTQVAAEATASAVNATATSVAATATAQAAATQTAIATVPQFTATWIGSGTVGQGSSAQVEVCAVDVYLPITVYIDVDGGNSTWPSKSVGSLNFPANDGVSQCQSVTITNSFSGRPINFTNAISVEIRSEAGEGGTLYAETANRNYSGFLA